MEKDNYMLISKKMAEYLLRDIQAITEQHDAMIKRVFVRLMMPVLATGLLMPVALFVP